MNEDQKEKKFWFERFKPFGIFCDYDYIESITLYITLSFVLCGCNLVRVGTAKTFPFFGK